MGGTIKCISNINKLQPKRLSIKVYDNRLFESPLKRRRPRSPQRCPSTVWRYYTFFQGL